MSELTSERMRRFDGIVQNLPSKLRLTLSSLSLLDNVSTQLLRLLVLNSSSLQVIAILADSMAFLSSGETEIFQTLLKLFRQICMIYSGASPLITVHDVAPGLWFPHSAPPLLLKGHEAYIVTAIRKANILIFLLTVLGCFNYGFEFLQDSFLDILCPNTTFAGDGSVDPNGKFLKTQAILYLDLKTQAYISALKDLVGDSDEIPALKQQELLDTIFGDEMADQLVLRRTGSAMGNPSELMLPSEREFIERCQRRRENLLQYSSFKKLVRDYDWGHFVKELLDYCHKNMGLIVWGRKGRGKSPLFTFDDSEFDPQVLYASGASVSEDAPAADPIDAASDSGSPTTASLVASHADGEAFEATGTTHAKDQYTTSIASAAVSASANRPIAPGNMVKKLKPKRNWTKDEEETLAAGLREVGPSWSKILDLYGPGGKLTEALKNRSQVQLKDKARNWKLAYLKTGRRLPEYLEKVTGTIERSYKSKQKPTQPEGLTQERQSGETSELFGPDSADASGFDPNLESNM